MFSSSSNSFDFENDDFFKGHHKYETELEYDPTPVMEIVVSIVSVVGIAVVIALCCKCCCSNKNKGRVLQPPPAAAPPALYPQQQYSTAVVPTAVMVSGAHVNASAYPTSGAPYPIAGAPYPTAGAPYPTGGAPYPAVAPYPTGAPMPQPSAPDAHALLGAAPPGWHRQALPPTYDQVMSGEPAKHPPYNPYAPH